MSISGIQLRSQHYQAMSVTLGGTKVAGAMDKIEDTVGVYYEGGASGEAVAFVFQADKILLPKADGSGLTIAQGAKIYFDNSAKKVTPTSGGNTLCGRCLSAAGATDTTVLCVLEGHIPA
jgi:predicted RecA/RadA family phage recombinase